MINLEDGIYEVIVKELELCHQQNLFLDEEADTPQYEEALETKVDYASKV